MNITITKNTKKSKYSLISDILLDLDELYDDLTYDNNEKETDCINSKIKIKEEVLRNLLK